MLYHDDTFVHTISHSMWTLVRDITLVILFDFTYLISFDVI